ncbi:MAG TPA: hypothetical protein VKH15_18370 [Candidatus Acidoferrum sp.]|nr:hypothetical protein [Candidatus Acidoferrum sp.]
MKKQFLRMLLIVCFAALGATAKAQSRGAIVVTLPFEFVVSGKTLPAGTYTVSRFSNDSFDGLILRNQENRMSVFVHPVEVESAQAGKPDMRFERIGESHLLSEIETSDHIYTIGVSRSTIMEAKVKQQGGTSASGESGGN